jgi:hypothetical protein
MASGHEVARERDWAGNIDGDFDADAAMEAELAALVRTSEAHAPEQGSPLPREETETRSRCRHRVDFALVRSYFVSSPSSSLPVAFLSSIQTP